MTMKQGSGRSGYSNSANLQSEVQSHSLHDFTQTALRTGGVSLTSDGGITHEAIAQRAFEIYEQSGCLPGCCGQNWAKAERDLRQQSKGGAR